MSILKKAITYMTDSDYRFCVDLRHGRLDNMPDEEFLKRRFKIKVGYDLNLEDPQTYNEKLQWLKLHDRKPLYTTLVDKYEVKDYVASIIGEKYIIPTLGVWEHFDDIDFDSLPDRFVLKTTHDSNGVMICSDKASFDYKAAKKKLEEHLKRNYYYFAREWPYKNVKPRIIAEKYLEDRETCELRDYKFFVFDGEAKAMFITTDRNLEDEETKFDFFDMDFRHLPFTNGHPNAKIRPKKPERFDEMRELAEKLGAGFTHIRIDFYEANGEIFFGEMTFYSRGGYVHFDQIEWDYTFGSWIKLPEKETAH